MAAGGVVQSRGHPSALCSPTRSTFLTGRNIGVDFQKERPGDHGEFWGTATLHIDDKAVADAEIRTLTGNFALCGEGLCIGYDGGDTVTGHYRGKFAFTGGEIEKVIFDVADDAYVDVEAHYEAAMSRD
ncbi:hypothetical protein [Nocardia bhagyanarayanae]|uniref:hypothetical protein n=1 Tax=Nocardia bhagyanarayanae TaxID=1215925 RepID=UPI001154E61F|nr:hypothetical protein [Nocardia bhagyanarayanae]